MLLSISVERSSFTHARMKLAGEALKPDTVRGPEVSFNLRSRQAEDPARSVFVTGAPDLAVEVVSPANSAAEMERKVGEYLAAGSQRVWVVYTATANAPRRVAVHHADCTTVAYGGDSVITDEELLPGFSLSLGEIFE